MTYREEDYDSVHEQIIDNLRVEYETWDDIKNTTAQGPHQKDICKSKMKAIERIAHNIKP